MKFKEPQLSFKDLPEGRIATVRLLTDKLWQMASVSFSDPEIPNESNSDERKRLVAKAKEHLLAAAEAL